MIFSEQLLTLMAIRIDCIPPNKRSLAEIALFLRDHYLNPSKKVNTRMPNPLPDFTYKAELIRVVDGDTLEVRIDCGFDIWHVCTLRLDGVDTPERNQPGWREATLATRDYCNTAGGELIVRTRPEPKRRQDSFRRYLAKVWVAGVPAVELGEFLLGQHHAVPWVKGGDK